MATVDEERVAAVRAFNRFYTNVIGLLRDGLFDTPFSLTEARVVFELAQRDSTELAELRGTLELDAGYLSRILTRLEGDGLVKRARSASDGRRQTIALTRRGRSAFAKLDRLSAREAGALLEGLGERERRRLVGAMGAIRELLGDREARPHATSYVLRRPLPGDLGWVVQSHGSTYADEYGWDDRFETLVARIVADFAESHDPRREAAWIAELDGEPAGCVFCVRDSDELARLRLLLVEPRARGLGMGARLVDECLRFARRAGYERMTLWTNDVLRHARPIYERAGFELVDEEPHSRFGPRVVGQSWERALA
ncbi:MAG TPA: helix-turn-helix domain-containing GNAT family N-acetyltransferase [Thermoleophilaceae bacterium]|jgi:DNA-binding MarR family transcriptional regulator/GNAT superfamily N-acetyltransferase